ncbi:MAG: winged helix-turn-helix transcriptional regulator [Proteobacteria bacterium]|nr:winged helix-turn-helix transcriptional regulator [Pseudomonadota bacterium]
MADLNELACWMRAAGDPGRLRILAICSEKPANVAEIARILAQSAPLTSHHLKALLTAGLLQKQRRGRRVEYFTPSRGAASDWIRGLFRHVDSSESVWQGDRESLARLTSHSVFKRNGSADFSRIDRALLTLVRGASLEPGGTASRPGLRSRWSRLLISTSRKAMVLGGSDLADSIDVMVDSAADAVALRTALASAGLVDSRVATRRSLDADSRFPALLLDALDLVGSAGNGVAAERLVERLVACAPHLMRGAQLWVFVDYDLLDAGGAREHPLLRLRRLLSEQGFTCDQLQPIEADGRHILAASATFRAAATQVA